MNVLFLMADDMRPELGCYGVEAVKTPNIDQFASTGVLFQNAYCNVPVSGASRASLLTGVYPHYPERFVSFSAMASKDCPEAIPLSGWFSSHSYYTISDGKVFHHIEDHADSWSEPPYRTHPDGYDVYWAEYNKWELWMNSASARTINPKTMRGPFCEWAEVPDTAYDDGKLAEKAIADLKRLKEKGKPFFLACGFWKPHLPFNAPKKYWDLYDREKIPVAENRFRPEGLPEEVKNSQEIYAYARTTSPDDIYFIKEAKHGYYACLSYVDAQIGKVLNALDELDLSKNTIVILLGDHGWHLGEHGFLGKHNLMNMSTHVPLIVRVPGMQKGKTKSLVEFVDIYPTLCELCNLPFPEQLDGMSFVPILKDLKKEIKDKVYIQWEGGDNAVDWRYNYAEWEKGSRMLFDHQVDVEENKNRADDPSYKNVVKNMSSFLQKKKRILNK
ncbi:sulfatase [Bacteroides mediterraneensis]|uniref:Sulfatase n=2 Tax=Bacteroides mediterraneensis TaxID=1841856 RepID=A0ABS2EWI4_9BACE|nr:sulfatase [Bacteroides mediterraneensis]MBM6758946.1 sulfatase [Bacteroides mediterraneensis]MBM6781018.1 sulfatase [Bacteroides mediterraneensis]